MTRAPWVPGDRVRVGTLTIGHGRRRRLATGTVRLVDPPDYPARGVVIDLDHGGEAFATHGELERATS